MGKRGFIQDFKWWPINASLNQVILYFKILGGGGGACFPMTNWLSQYKKQNKKTTSQFPFMIQQQSFQLSTQQPSKRKSVHLWCNTALQIQGYFAQPPLKSWGLSFHSISTGELFFLPLTSSADPIPAFPVICSPATTKVTQENVSAYTRISKPTDRPNIIARKQRGGTSHWTHTAAPLHKRNPAEPLNEESAANHSTQTSNPYQTPTFAKAGLPHPHIRCLGWLHILKQGFEPIAPKDSKCAENRVLQLLWRPGRACLTGVKLEARHFGRSCLARICDFVKRLETVVEWGGQGGWKMRGGGQQYYRFGGREKEIGGKGVGVGTLLRGGKLKREEEKVLLPYPGSLTPTPPRFPISLGAGSFANLPPPSIPQRLPAAGGSTATSPRPAGLTVGRTRSPPR